MTIICSMHQPGVGTWIGGDTLVCAHNETVGFTRKWILKGGAALGLCGSNVMQGWIEDSVAFDAGTKPVALFRSVVAALKENDFKPKQEDENPSLWGFAALFATPERVVRINGCGSVVGWFPDGFAATGSGANYAEGAAHALVRDGKTEAEVVSHAVRAAMAWDRGCGGDLWLDCLRLPA